MNHLNWKRRLLGALGAAALGLTGAAWAQETQVEQEAEQQKEQAGQELGETGQEAGQEMQEAGQELQQEEAVGGAGQQEEEETVGENVSEAAEGVTQKAGEAVERTGQRAEELFEGRPAEPELRVTGEVGVSNWAGNLGDALNTGPQWGVTVGGQVYNMLGVEVGYNGQRNAIAEQYAAPTNSAIFRHGLDALLKVGPRVMEERLHPYGGVGFGLAFVNPNAAADPVVDNDFITELPLAVGVDYDSGPLTAGVRGAWRWTFGEQFAEPLLGDDSEGSIFGATLMFGGKF